MRCVNQGTLADWKTARSIKGENMKRLLAILAFGIAAITLPGTSAYAHGCHPDVRLDKYGWHRHASNDCDRINVERGEFRRRHHHDDDDGPRCANVKRCHSIGPFKECKWVQECL